MREPTGKDARLRCRVVRGQLVISIGVETLAHAFVHGPIGDGLAFNQESGHWEDDRRPRVTNVAEFAREVVLALTHEKEDGSSPLTDLIDKAYRDALDDGALSVELPDPDTPVALTGAADGR